MDPLNNVTTGLLSIPGSGNSWVMNLIQLATGKFIGSVYVGKNKINFPYYEFDNSSVIVVKDHLFQKTRYRRSILVVRDPLETAISPSNSLNKAVDFKDTKFDKDLLKDESYLRRKITSWRDWHERLINEKYDFCVIFYHELKENVIEAIRPCIQYLGYLIPTDLEKCILENQEGFFHRKERSQQEKEELHSMFSQDDIQFAKKIKKIYFRQLRTYSSNPIACND